MHFAELMTPTQWVKYTMVKLQNWFLVVKGFPLINSDCLSVYIWLHSNYAYIATVHNLWPYGQRSHAAFDNEICSHPHVFSNIRFGGRAGIYWSKTNATQKSVDRMHNNLDGNVTKSYRM